MNQLGNNINRPINTGLNHLGINQNQNQLNNNQNQLNNNQNQRPTALANGNPLNCNNNNFNVDPSLCPNFIPQGRNSKANRFCSLQFLRNCSKIDAVFLTSNQMKMEYQAVNVKAKKPVNFF